MPPRENHLENPFAAPETDPSTTVDEAPELYGRMPTSVMLAIVCVAGILVLNALVLLAAVVDSDEVTVIIFLTPLLLGALILAGLFRRSRQARVAARILSLLGGVLGVLWVITGFFGLLMILSPSFGLGVDEDPAQVVMFLAIGIGLVCLPVAMLWTVFLSLGQPTALAYFGMICPACHARRARPADLWYRTLRCKACGHVWS